MRSRREGRKGEETLASFFSRLSLHHLSLSRHTLSLFSLSLSTDHSLSLSLIATLSLSPTLTLTGSILNSFEEEYQVGEQFDLRFSFVANRFEIKIHPFVMVELFDD